MKFKGDIVIVDPMLVSKDSDWGSDFDWENNRVNGFSNYIWKDVDECNQFIECYTRVNNKPVIKESVLKEEIDEFLKEDTSTFQYTGDINVTGSGSIGIFLLEEVNNYNPDFINSDNDYVVISGFDGRVIIDYDEENNEFHILGLGNKAFFTL